jgi:hypothetical protein
VPRKINTPACSQTSGYPEGIISGSVSVRNVITTIEREVMLTKSLK